MIVTFDLGTTGNKLTLWNKEGQLVCAHTVPYHTQFPRAGWAEQKCEDFFSSCVNGLPLLLEKSGAIAQNIEAIGLSGHMNGCIPVDAVGQALHPNIIHSDGRTGAQCARIAQALPPKEFYRVTGNRIDPHCTLPKILWLKDSLPDVFNRAAFFVNTKDYIHGRLTGRTGFTDYSDASLCAMLDISKRRWAGDLLRDLSVPLGKLPQILPSAHAHPLCGEAARALNLREGIPVSIGGGDGACAAHGAGVAESRMAYAYVGSTAWISLMGDEPMFDQGMRTFNYVDLDGTHVHTTGTVQNAAAAYDWALEMLGFAGEDRFARAEALARQAPDGAGGVLFSPYLMGERTPHWDPDAKGALFGFTLLHTRSHILRAVYEGLGFALCDVLACFRENGRNPLNLFLIGGGAKSALWPELFCNIFNLPVSVHPAPGSATSQGAAMTAGVGVGIWKDYADAARRIEYARRLEPDEGRARGYAAGHKKYRALYPAFKPLY